MSNTYTDQLSRDITLKMRGLLTELPVFLPDFFRYLNPQTSPRTRLAYAYDLKLFFDFLSKECPEFDGKSPREFSVADLELVTDAHLEEFLDYLDLYYRDNQVEVQNHNSGKSRKLSAVRSMLRYFFKKKRISQNVADQVDTPKIPEKAITYLEANEIADLLDEVESGDHLTKKQKEAHDKNMARDLAIVSLLLGTGMRVSECVGIDLQHLDLRENAVLVTRKGGKEVVLYFGDEVREALNAYLSQRREMIPLPGHERALFLSGQNRRITDRAVQLLVKKYASSATPLKHITPHKLRSSFGTQLYKETGDIYLVSTALGHANVDTTRKHYAHIEDEDRRKPARILKLRKD